MHYDVIIIGAGPGGIYSAYELIKIKPGLKIAVFEAGNELSKRKCPINGDTVNTVITVSMDEEEAPEEVRKYAGK